MTTQKQSVLQSASAEAAKVSGSELRSGGGFGPLRNRILKQRRISYEDYQDLRSAHILMDDHTASMVWRLIKTYERCNLSVRPLNAAEIEAIAESWPNVKDEPTPGGALTQSQPNPK